MLSLGQTVFIWARESASDLLDLANAGRAADNHVTLTIVAILAIIRFVAFLFLTLPALACLYNILFKKVKREEAGLRAVLIILIVASMLFELWVSPTRTPETGADAGIAIVEQAEGGDG